MNSQLLTNCRQCGQSEHETGNTKHELLGKRLKQKSTALRGFIAQRPRVLPR